MNSSYHALALLSALRILVAGLDPQQLLHDSQPQHCWKCRGFSAVRETATLLGLSTFRQNFDSCSDSVPLRRP